LKQQALEEASQRLNARVIFLIDLTDQALAIILEGF
jgi:hypothetical protein